MLDVNAIFQHIPHRYPFLLVDRILEIHGEEKIVGIKNVSINEHFFLGHFPNRPVMPGVLICEAMAQVGAIFAHNARGGTGDRVGRRRTGGERARAARRGGVDGGRAAGHRVHRVVGRLDGQQPARRDQGREQDGKRKRTSHPHAQRS